MDPKRAYHHGDLRRQLIDGAVAFAAEHGPAAFSLSALARALGVSTAAPYRHFVDKEALFAAVAEEGYRRLGELLAAARRDAPVESVVEMGHAYLRFADTDRGHFAVMFGGGVDKERFPEVRAAGDAALGLLVEEITRAGGAAAEPDRTARSSAAFERATLIASGDGGGRDGAHGRPDADDNGASDAEKERDEPGARARVGDALTVWALAHGFATLAREGLWAETPGAPDLHEAAEVAVRTLLAGLRSAGPNA